MAKLLKHKLDCVRHCPACGKMVEARYDGAQIVKDPSTGENAEARQYTCMGCRQTYNADFEPRPDTSDDDLLTVTDLRAWARWRKFVELLERESPGHYSVPATEIVQ